MSDERAGAGSGVLSLFANPLSAKVLRAHADGPIRPSALYREVGWSAQTTVRRCVANLREAGALAKHRIGGSPYAVENELTTAGEEMLLVAEAVEDWLARAPGGPLPLEGDAAKMAIKALVGGWSWSSPVMQVFATGPHSLAELDRVTPGVSYPLLKRRLAEMRLSRQVELVAAGDGNAPKRFAASEWLRRSIAPLSVAARCESRHMAETAEPISAAEIETLLLLGAPLVEPQGITVSIGQVSEVRTPETWFDLLIDGRSGAAIPLSKGNPRPMVDFIDAIHRALFAVPRTRRSGIA